MNSKNKHTPGNWCVSKTSHNWSIYSDNYTPDIATVRTSEHDAHLIAAAPELLEALEETLKCLTMDSDSERDYAPEIQQARQAIAKAKGDA